MRLYTNKLSYSFFFPLDQRRGRTEMKLMRVGYDILFRTETEEKSPTHIYAVDVTT